MSNLTLPTTTFLSFFPTKTRAHRLDDGHRHYSSFPMSLTTSRCLVLDSLVALCPPSGLRNPSLQIRLGKGFGFFSRVAEQANRPELHHHSSMSGPVVTREDVFGPVPPKDVATVGAIGDGRKKITPDFEPHTHVEQLLRTLDLSSPDPYNLAPKFETSPGTPDFSPASNSSVLLTPSPPRPYDLNPNVKQQFHSPYEVFPSGARGPAYLTPSSVLYEPTSPTRPSHSPPYLTSHQANIAAANSGGLNYPIISNASSYPIFKSYNSEQSSTTPNAHSLPSAPSYALYHSSPQVNLPSNHQLYAALSAQHLQSNAARRADVHSATGVPRSLVQSSTGSGLSGEWYIPQQVLPAPALLSSASNMQYQQQPLPQPQQQQVQVTSNGEWLRSDDSLLLAQSGGMPSVSSAASSASATPNALGLGLGLEPASFGGGGLEDSIHAPPSLRSSTSPTSSGYVSHQQPSHAHSDGHSTPSASSGYLSQQQSFNAHNDAHGTFSASASGGYGSHQQPSHTNDGHHHQQHHHRHQSSAGHVRDPSSSPTQGAHEPINFLSLLHPSSSPPYHTFVSRIIKSSDQQASIFLQQKLKVADVAERSKIIRELGGSALLGSRRYCRGKEKDCFMHEGRIVDLATNCYGCHVLQKALDCEEDIRLLIVSDHVWSKIMELTWTPPAPPIFAFVNKSLKGKWAALACHETGSLVVQHAFENLEDSAKDGIVDELLNQGPSVFSEVAKKPVGFLLLLEHGSDKHRQLTLEHLIAGLLDYATNEQGYKSITKALKEGGKDTLDRVVKRMCEPAKSSSRRAMVVDLALSVTGSQLIASVLPSADREQRALLYDCIRGHIVTLRGCKTGSKVIWLFDRMRAYYGY
ncbi:ARM repeat-containing protein [Gymnopus androsaceus JB14]|uniref:ARM repeat-containing protein n=1 Tax=Gymnopus androsaceus JB14 TaxID=1447944 RepID=A0A6A4HP92_9AGAR|nr:ARM repeat-containing protein [Gymnopus androsaceus JB14]